MKGQNRKTAGGFKRMTMDMSEKMAREIAQQLGLGSSKMSADRLFSHWKEKVMRSW